jgi:hypothetical protein
VSVVPIVQSSGTMPSWQRSPALGRATQNESAGLTDAASAVAGRPSSGHGDVGRVARLAWHELRRTIYCVAIVCGLSATITQANAAPSTVTSVSPNAGLTAAGTSVTITGTNFTGATALKFGGTAATGVTLAD